MSEFTVGQKVRLAKVDPELLASPIATLFGAPEIGEEGVVMELDPADAPEGALFVKFDSYGYFGVLDNEIESI